ncbi:MAG: C4-dicarboxylate TRAP transporter substrate-binding protein [Ectothiorhodospiraceae bacterium]|nr:C4-dicarboxylate TRAP transporter substrate-binding protein [Ectothiorhodospiraceae bacterium]
MKSLRKLAVLAAAGVCGVALLANSASARTISYALGIPPSSDTVRAAEVFAEALEEYSGGELKARLFPLSLLNAAETSAGVRDGIADAGYLLTAYFPGEYPHTNLINDTSMQLNLFEDLDGWVAAMAYVGAKSELLFQHCPECNAEYAAQNQVFTGAAASSVYGLLCTTPIKSVADVRGKRLRVAGSHWSRWSSHFGAQSLSLTYNEIYEALAQGVIDCTIQSAPELKNIRLVEQATYVNMDVPGGVYSGVNSVSLNRDVWASLTEDQRRAFLRATAVMSAEHTIGYLAIEEEMLEEVRSRGNQVISAEPELIEATREFTEKDLQTALEVYADRHNVVRGEEILEQFGELLEKWIQLVDGVDNPQDLAQIYWDEVFSKVDVSSHGL